MRSRKFLNTVLISKIEYQCHHSYFPPNDPSCARPLALHHRILSKLQTSRNPTKFNQILTQTITTGLLHSTFASSPLLKFSPNLKLTNLIFSQIKHPDLFSYNLLIKAYSTTSPNPLHSFSLYRKLLARGLHPNEYTFCFLLDCCAKAIALAQGQQVHCHLVKHGIHFNTFSSTSLVHMYGDCGETLYARRAFDQMLHKSSASWGAMIDALVMNGCAIDGLRLFGEMISLRAELGNSTLVGAVCACAELGALRTGKAVHGIVVANGFEMSVTLGTSLVDMYSKCGAVDMAMEVFLSIPERNVATWNSMIHGLAMNGHGFRALELFKEMDVTPNGVTFLGLLQACSHARLVEHGVNYFRQMSEYYGIEPNIKHYGCIVDLYARAGWIQEAMEVIASMGVRPDTMIWGALLGGCRIHGYWELGEIVAVKIIKMAPSDECGYLLLSDSFAKGRRWDDVVGVRKMMKELDIRKLTGGSFMCL